MGLQNSTPINNNNINKHSNHCLDLLDESFGLVAFTINVYQIETQITDHYEI